MSALVDTRDGYRGLFDIYWPIGVGVLVLFWLLIIGFAWRYRRREDGRPPDVHEHSLLEGSYVALLACVCAVLVYFTFHWMSKDVADLPGEPSSKGQTDVALAATPKPAITVDVTASRWNWTFQYPKYGIRQSGNGTQIPTLVVPTGNVTFRLTSIDVIHAFFIPFLRFKRDAFPERPTNFTLGFHEVGFHHAWGECAEFCGYRHAYMQFNVDVRTPSDFRRWAAARRAGQPQRLTPAMGRQGDYR
ncbi:MAG TPA: cytochrome c oxidase subunit II [Baekduia sp.]|nr:cytochrome c oxidase subunit II [Baekduia sp.]